MRTHHFAIIHYCPDEFAAERIAVGVVLASFDGPSDFRCEALWMSDAASRIQALWPKLDADNFWHAVDSVVQRVTRIEVPHSLAEFARFCVTRTGQIQFTEPRGTVEITVEELLAMLERRIAP